MNLKVCAPHLRIGVGCRRVEIATLNFKANYWVILIHDIILSLALLTAGYRTDNRRLLLRVSTY